MLTDLVYTYVLISYPCENGRSTCAGAGGRYELVEPMLALRSVLMRTLERPERCVAVLLHAARLARKAGRLAHATAALHSAKGITVGSIDPVQQLLQQQEEAKLLWAQGQKSAAVRMAQALAAGQEDGTNAAMRARLLCLAGNWLTESRHVPCDSCQWDCCVWPVLPARFKHCLSGSKRTLVVNLLQIRRLIRDFDSAGVGGSDLTAAQQCRDRGARRRRARVPRAVPLCALRRSTVSPR